MKDKIIDRCKTLGIAFRQNPKATPYRHKYIIISTLRGVVGFDYLSDVNMYLDLYENETEFYIEYNDQ